MAFRAKLAVHVKAFPFKRPEKELSKYVRKYLSDMKGIGLIIWWGRLQSGRLRVVKGKYSHWMNLCESGTPDFFAIRRDGLMIWIETKAAGEDLRVSQQDFASKITGLPGHIFIKAYSLDQVISVMH